MIFSLPIVSSRFLIVQTNALKEML